MAQGQGKGQQPKKTQTGSTHDEAQLEAEAAQEEAQSDAPSADQAVKEANSNRHEVTSKTPNGNTVKDR